MDLLTSRIEFLDLHTPITTLSGGDLETMIGRNIGEIESQKYHPDSILVHLKVLRVSRIEHMPEHVISRHRIG